MADRLLQTEDEPFEIDLSALRALRAALPSVATHTVNAVTSEVADYRGARRGPMRETIEEAVQMALAGFLKLAGRARDVDPSTPLAPAIEGAYALGRGEARGGRSMDALLAAYRVGARVSWREWARTAAEAGLGATGMARFAELLFAYIDGLSAASVAGHTDELTTSGRVRERYRERLAYHLVSGAAEPVLTRAADRAGWTPAEALTVVLLPDALLHGVLPLLDADALVLRDELPASDGWPVDQPFSLILVPAAAGPGRRHLLRVLAGRPAVVGPARPLTGVPASYERAARTLRLAGPQWDGRPLDTEERLSDLVLEADHEARQDLRAQVLAPLAELPAASRDRLAETLSSWLLHQGQRARVAEQLHVHPQTVRYRMGQLREAYGERLQDPRFVRDAVVALAPA